ncbi:hypothetical protein [Desulfosporosinus sp.]|uniref:hypothetical protein n=1 Tax=Desulfosporosinus sp. TaxID=157907 RepID=UPI00230F990B|nr:hypothetical protein [Desulfosporosinus sp.]MCO5386132.1 hypothetical protein [Desulfosporosinus sp.]MDA8220498.1 hypothetical protein [Desulfitobacterium hafniense]
MTFLIGLVLVAAIYCWTANSRYEWSIPHKWQDFIGAWRERLSNKSHSVFLVCDGGSENGEMEKQLWLLQKALPNLQKSDKLPLSIEVKINSDLFQEQNEKYIACLQRRFSEMEISGYSLGDKQDVRNDHTV